MDKETILELRKLAVEINERMIKFNDILREEFLSREIDCGSGCKIFKPELPEKKKE